MINQYLAEGFFSALEKHGFDTSSTEMAISGRYGDIDKTASQGHSFDTMFVLAIRKLAFDIAKARRVGEGAVGYAKRMGRLAKTTATEAKQIAHAKAPPMPSKVTSTAASDKQKKLRSLYSM